MAGLLLPSRGGHCCTAVNLLLGLFHVLLPCFRQGGGQVIEPVPSMVELWQAEESELLLPPQTESSQNTEQHLQEQNVARPSGKALHLQPSVLDFGTQSVGLPKVQSFCAFNPSRDTDIEVNSVFTSSRNFHVSTVHSMVIPARGKSSFTVVFLPDEEGNFEGSLFINTTSHGILSYQVFGLGVNSAASKYSKQSPQNTDVLFPRIVNIHLSQSQAEAINSSVWQVRLKCSIPLRQRQQQHCKSCFLSGQSLQLQVYFAVRLEGGQHDLETLRKYILENIYMVFVTSEQKDDSMIMYVLNSGSGLVHMQDVHHFLDDTLSVKFEPVMLLSSSISFTKAATIVCSVASRETELDCSRETNPGLSQAASPPSPCTSHNKTEGYLNFDASKISFYMQQLPDPLGLWSMWLENNLNFNIILSDVFVPEQVKEILKILNFTNLLTLSPGCWNIFSWKIQAKELPLNFLSNIMVATSLGVTFEIPLLIQNAVPASESQHLRISAQCGIHPVIRRLSSEENVRWHQSLSLGMSAWRIDYELGTELYAKHLKKQDGDKCRKKSGENSSSTPQKSGAKRLINFFPQLIAEANLVVNFTATALSNSSVQYVMLKNPSPFAVRVQLLPLSHYPNPQAALNLLSNWYGTNEQEIDFTTAEFKLQTPCETQENPDECITEVLELNLPPWESQQVGIIFAPLDYRKVTSLIIVRNNLTVLDLITVEGLGAREMLRVGGRLPGIGGSLRFKVPESTLMDCRQQLKDSKHVLSITKMFKVENIGSLPLTIVAMKINGYNCQGFGFEVLDCNTFSLSQNTSREINIVFIPDFTSSWVIRELTLVSASNIEFRFTLNVTLPHHLLPLCADGVPGPSWEESFWRLTVLFVSLSLIGVVLIAFQQAQYILSDFLKLRHRNNSSSSTHHNSNPVDTITSESYRGSCKSFTDSSSPPDKGKGKGYLAVAAPPIRSQNASKRGPATYSHSQKKQHKCSVYYSIKQKPSSVGSNTAACDTTQLLSTETQPPPPKDSACGETEKWMILNTLDSVATGNQKHLTNPDSNLGKEDSALQTTLLQQRTANESTLKEEPIICMFPMETTYKTSSETQSEPKQQNCCVFSAVSGKLPEDYLSRCNPSSQNVSPPLPRKPEGNKHRVSQITHKEGIETSKKLVNQDVPLEKEPQNIDHEEKICGKLGTSPAKDEQFRRKNPAEKRDGMFPNLNWTKTRTCAKKNKKKNCVFPARVKEQSALKHNYQDGDRPELRAPNRAKTWNALTNGGDCRAEQKNRLPARGDTECYQILKKKSVEKFSSDSSSECGSSHGSSVRASRGSWGSWSSASSSDGDKKNAIQNRLYFPQRENLSQNSFSVENPIALNLSHSICNTRPEVNTISHYPDILSSPFSESSDPEKNESLYSQEDVWSSQPVCLRNDLNYNFENAVTCVTQDPSPVQNGFIDWNSARDGQFSGMYGSLELNDFNSYSEENMNYHNGFPCPDVQNPAFIDQCPSSWNINPPAAPPQPPPPPPAPTMPNSWEQPNYVSSSPFLSSTRSLSPMSGLFGSIWAPQNDVFDGYCSVTGSPPHSDHIGSHSMMCKQEYSSRFNPFHAYMNLDIWTSANRNATYPVSRDSGYCGNM